MSGVLRLPQNLHSSFTKRAAAGPEGSGTAPATKSALQLRQALRLPYDKMQLRPSGDHARRSWSGRLWTLCTAPATKSPLQVHQPLRLPHKRQPRPSADQARRSSSRSAPATKSPLQVHQAKRCTSGFTEWCEMSGVRWAVSDEWCKMGWCKMGGVR